ncbi:hypothetical protein K2Q08_02900 [Patescibacteria group bacterium]|nr:hypothetical protein [Patescibacteria group bacterium]
MKNSGVKVTVPEEFAEAVDRAVRDTLSLKAVCTDKKEIPGKTQIFYSADGDLDGWVTEIYALILPFTNSNFAVCKF